MHGSLILINLFFLVFINDFLVFINHFLVLLNKSFSTIYNSFSTICKWQPFINIKKKIYKY